MSTNSYDPSLSFARGEAKKPGFYARFKDYMAGMRAGLEAWREYERLRMNGVQPSVAAAKAFEKHYE